MIRSLCAKVVFVSFLLLSASAFANSVQLMDFTGLGDLQTVGNFYNGSGVPGTPNYGVTFSSNFFGLRAIANGGSGNFAGTPTATPAIFMNGTTGANITGTMNVTTGFSGGLNFFYTAGFAPGKTETVTVWSGANGTGTVLAMLTLSNNNSGCTAPLYCAWSNAGLSFTGTAESVTFTGPANELGLSTITIGSNMTSIPEPSSLMLMGAGLVGIVARKLRQRAA